MLKLMRPTGTRDDAKSEIFRDFCRRLFHGCLAVVNDSTKPYMTMWDIVYCADYHFRRAIYGIGPHIADYPEQSLAAGVVYGWCVTSVSPYCPLRLSENIFL
jgi:hypothetical protein